MFCYFTSLRLGLFWIFVCFYCNPLGERCRWQYLAMAIFCFAYFGWRFFHNESLPGYHLWVSTHMSSIYHAQYSDGQKFLFALTTGCPKLNCRYSAPYFFLFWIEFFMKNAFFSCTVVVETFCAQTQIAIYTSFWNEIILEMKVTFLKKSTFWFVWSFFDKHCHWC